MAGSVVFILALLPTLLGSAKPPVTTSVLTGSVLAVFAVVYSTLGFWFSVVTGAILSLCWFVVAIQAWKSDQYSNVEV